MKRRMRWGAQGPDTIEFVTDHKHEAVAYVLDNPEARLVRVAHYTQGSNK